MPRHKPMEEPDVTPLINVNLVLLVMTLAIASHAARLLPLAVPKATDRTTFIGMDEAVVLAIGQDNKYTLLDAAGLDADQLAKEIGLLPKQSIVLVSPHPKAKYEALVQAVDRLIARTDLRIAFGYRGRPAAAKAAGADKTKAAGKNKNAKK